VLVRAHDLAEMGLQIQWGAGENEARAVTFIALTIGNLGLVLANLSHAILAPAAGRS
jgi:hypothetical protein